MMHGQAWAWVTLFLLGAYHGINPAMGWLFAVALGLQKKSGRAVWESLLPIATGHVAAIAAVILVAVVAGAVVPAHVLRIARGGHSDWLRRVPHREQKPSALWRHASWISRSDDMVVPDGLRSRCRIDALAGFAGDVRDGGGS